MVNFVTERDEALWQMICENVASGESLEGLFSRKRGLRRRSLLKMERTNGDGDDVDKFVGSSV